MRLAGSAVLALLSLLPAPAGARETMPKDFVYLRDVAPTIAQEMRYATSDNFTARPLPGYRAGECVLRRDAALALAKVAQDLAAQQLGLKVYDCYRPQRAVRAFWRWSQDRRSDGDKRFYPNVPKSALFGLGYIASHSRHSAGTAVDLTLVALSATVRSRASGKPASQIQTLPVAPGSPLARGRTENQNAPCTAPASERAPANSLDNSLDMGTGFDCLDVKSYTHSRAVTPEQRHRRDLLKAAMSARGFRNYFREWWHYEYGAPRGYYDFPIVPKH